MSFAKGLVFPDATAVLIGALVARFAEPEVEAVWPGVDVKPLRPKELETSVPKRAVLVRRIGGPRHNFATDQPRMDIQCFHDDPPKAAALAAFVYRFVMYELPQTRGVTGAEDVAGPTPVDDPTGQPRQQMTIEIQTRGVVAS